MQEVVEEIEHQKRRVWELLHQYEGYFFETAKGLKYNYYIRGNEIFFSRKEKSITKSTVDKALETAIRLQEEGTKIKGPKMLRCFGASYLYPIFIQFGVIK